MEEDDGAISRLLEGTGIKTKSSLIALISSDAFAISYTALCVCHSLDCCKNDEKQGSKAEVCLANTVPT